jgi:hypothetical protein
VVEQKGRQAFQSPVWDPIVQAPDISPLDLGEYG